MNCPETLAEPTFCFYLQGILQAAFSNIIFDVKTNLQA
jgi:hypothetical protein